MRILAVDDDPVMLDLLRMTLEASKFCELTCAASADAALAAIAQAQAPFDTFLLDIMMDGRDGVELCGDIRQLHPYKATPIIMITASRKHALMERAFSAGATDYVTKPLDGLELGTRINLARMLNDSLSREKISRVKLGAFKQTGYFAPFPVLEPDYSVDALELEQSLAALPRGFYTMALLSVQFVGGETTFATLDAEAWVARMRLLGNAIAAALPHDGVRIAHFGQGGWVAVVNGRRGLNLPSLQAGVTAALAANGIEDGLLVKAIDGRTLWSGEMAATALQAHRLEPPMRAPKPETAKLPEQLILLDREVARVSERPRTAPVPAPQITVIEEEADAQIDDDLDAGDAPDTEVALHPVAATKLAARKMDMRECAMKEVDDEELFAKAARLIAARHDENNKRGSGD